MKEECVFTEGEVIRVKSRVQIFKYARIISVMIDSAVVQYINNGEYGVVSLKDIETLANECPLLSQRKGTPIYMKRNAVVENFCKKYIKSRIVQFDNIHYKHVVPQELLQFIQTNNIAIIINPSIEAKIAKWLERISLGKIPIEHLINIKAAKAIESFCKLSENESLFQGLYFLAECSLRKLENISFDSLFCGKNDTRPKNNNLKLEVIITKHKANSKVVQPAIGYENNFLKTKLKASVAEPKGIIERVYLFDDIDGRKLVLWRFTNLFLQKIYT